jgi:predicted DNA-binding transcriptional regulator AlpA
MTFEGFFTEIEVCEILRISRKTLHGRISRGTEHPPATPIGRGNYVFNKRLFEEWIGKRPILNEIRRVG